MIFNNKTNFNKTTFGFATGSQRVRKMEKIIKSLTTNRVRNCSLSLVLDTRTNKNTEVFPLSVYFHVRENGERKRYYHHLGEFYTEKYFNEVCQTTASRSSLLPIKKQWEKMLDGYRERLVKLSKSHPILSVELIKGCLSGKIADGEHTTSFLKVWEKVIASRREEGRAGTAQSYQCALRSFLLIVGEVSGFAIDKTVISRWDKGMRDGVRKNGKIVGKIADATRGIYLRTCRVIWNECRRQGFLSEVEYPFSNKDNSLVSIPKGKRRQKSYLSVEEMTELYKVFLEKRYPNDRWTEDYIRKVHYSLGLFLAQYLCNGFNLADQARLRYNQTYWQEGGRAFEFQRKKTASRSGDNSTVIVPIIEPLKAILNEIAAPPTKNGYVFPQIFRGVTDEEERRKIQLKEHSNMKDRVRRVCKEVLHWDKELVSSTWARHSFATNLKLAGVEEEYIAESMGHSHGNDVTAGYQDMYPLEVRFKNNMKLLKLDEGDAREIDVDKMSVEEMRQLLKTMLRS